MICVFFGSRRLNKVSFSKILPPTRVLKTLLKNSRNRKSTLELLLAAFLIKIITGQTIFLSFNFSFSLSASLCSLSPHRPRVHSFEIFSFSFSDQGEWISNIPGLKVFRKEISPTELPSRAVRLLLLLVGNILCQAPAHWPEACLSCSSKLSTFIWFPRFPLYLDVSKIILFGCYHVGIHPYVCERWRRCGAVHIGEVRGQLCS